MPKGRYKPQLPVKAVMIGIIPESHNYDLKIIPAVPIRNTSIILITFSVLPKLRFIVAVLAKVK